MIDLIWLVPLVPLIGFLINGLGRNFLPKNLAAMIACGSVLISFVISIMIFSDVYQARQIGESASTHVLLFEWFQVGSLNISMSFLVDPLSSVMLLIITGIGFLIHIYSVGYMKADEGFNKFFAYLNLFIFFMLLLVLGSNYLVMFIGWEGVGLCSYLLIGFWYKNSSFAGAGKKAFIMNRIGDLAFLIAVFLIFLSFGSIEFATVFPQAATMMSGDSTLVLISMLLFIAATGKSAQIPLFTWLPDAMAGPTPVSALIHAATMVTAGVYMIVRSNILFTLSPIVMQVVAVIGLCTALIAALTALTQTDIKKVLAYSTVSQLGYMFLALGVGAFTGALFHVITHAFFKALLFLGAGSVIHAMSNEQDLRQMGGLRKKLPITFVTMLIGTIAISGIPPLSGFFSKDEILAHAFAENSIFWAGGFLAALFTAFYMFRLLFLTFYGKFRGTFAQESHLHESPLTMVIPLIILAVLSVVGGFLNIPAALGGNSGLSSFLEPIFVHSAAVSKPFHLDHSTEYLLMALSSIGAVVMAVYAYIRYAKKHHVPGGEQQARVGLAKLSYHKFYVDEIYDALIVRPLKSFSLFLHRIVDRALIDGLVNGVGKGVYESGKVLRLAQSGNVGFYLFLMVVGIIALLLYGFLTV